MKRILALLCVAAQAFAGTYTTSPAPHNYYVAVMPNSNTTLVTGTVYLSQIILINDSSGSVTVTVKDRGTDCSSGACLLMPSGITIAAKTSYHMEYDNQVAPSGIQGSASDGTSVTIRIHYKTTMNLP